ncbi:hypothetical protein H7J87_12290 [Mycolicibacterium wolinskyi]|uniref:Uncharacterized protein n=1 Tax=Mycolicibacterium wolinskyi TaxID=59750 RepID=A0A1X2FKM3_9MYCO|nr:MULTISPECIES: hypothetical protein [Mycolicibacterium]MCV7286109.1 hypothetical protein [Mycolicibacterium wolinskyi]MCV7296305.1 hypothetical protein [Mycolicibacterium goodii]ORX18529.1 hypothetical protein AWC31_14615 [Mycolicibacterium wolinskyi]
MSNPFTILGAACHADIAVQSACGAACPAVITVEQIVLIDKTRVAGLQNQWYPSMQRAHRIQRPGAPLALVDDPLDVRRDRQIFGLAVQPDHLSDVSEVVAKHDGNSGQMIRGLYEIRWILSGQSA